MKTPRSRLRFEFGELPCPGTHGVGSTMIERTSSAVRTAPLVIAHDLGTHRARTKKRLCDWTWDTPAKGLEIHTWKASRRSSLFRIGLRLATRDHASDV